MPSVKHTDLGDVMPGPKADLLVDRQRVTLHLGGLGLRMRLGAEHTTSGASHVAATLVALTAGAVPAAMISLVGAVVGAPGWLVVSLAAALSITHLAVGAVLIERQRRQRPGPSSDAVGRPDGPRPATTAPTGSKRGRKR